MATATMRTDTEAPLERELHYQENSIKNFSLAEATLESGQNNEVQDGTPLDPLKAVAIEKQQAA